MAEYFIHPSSFKDDTAIIGDNTKIWHFSHILKNTAIGQNCSFGQNCVVGPNVKIGNGVKVQNNISIYEGVECEDDVFLGPSMVFTNVINPRSFIVRKTEFKKTLIKKGSSIGANATVVCGVTIGEYALIGAGSVVTKDVPPYALVAGIPAVIKKYRFNDVLCKKLLDSQWYNYDLADFCHLDTTNPEAFVDDFENLKEKNSLQLYSPPKISLYDFFFPRQ